MTTSKYNSLQFVNESQFQAATFQYINNNYKELRGFFFHPPNENQHRLISMGILPGIPDFVFIKPKMWAMELKHGKGRLSEAQIKLHAKWAENNIRTFVVYNQSQVIQALNEMQFF
jgi:hypothetical protein